MTVAQWAERYRYLSDTSALPGKYSLKITPYLQGILEAITDRRVRKIACMKSAQVGWTDGVINNFIGYAMHLAPAPIGVMFPRDQTAKDFNVEKLIPMIEATPALASIVRTKTRTLDNTQNRKVFPGGFLKLFGSNSTGGVKSTPFKVIVIEEPDDCNLNIKGQGDSIKMAEERVKTFYDSKILAGGTPSIKGVSSIESEMQLSDQRRYFVPCHECGEAHELQWENVQYQSVPGTNHEVFGDARPDTARYVCPHCGALWTDADRIRNVRSGIWHASAEFHGVAGFYLNELVSAFPESRLQRLVEKYLSARYEFDKGEPGALIAFTNSTLGQSYEYQSDTPNADALRERAENYAEYSVPAGGLVLTIGADVQHDRIAYVVRAWGRGEESWLIAWGEVHGSTIVPEAGAWVDLDALIRREYTHATGAQLRIRAGSIDSSDGTTADAVYTFVRNRRALNLMAIKGASEAGAEKREIFSIPKTAVDLDRKQKAWKHGLRPFIVGTTRAKDLILGGEGAGRIKLDGNGPGRMHWYASVRPDYWDQITSEIKAPHRTVRNKKVWQKKSGVRNEALDCEVYALHAARSLKLNLMRDAQWQALEAQIRQRSLLTEEAPQHDDVDGETPADETEAPATDNPPAKAIAPPRPVMQQRPGRGGGRGSIRNR